MMTACNRYMISHCAFQVMGIYQSLLRFDQRANAKSNS